MLRIITSRENKDVFNEFQNFNESIRIIQDLLEINPRLYSLLIHVAGGERELSDYLKSVDLTPAPTALRIYAAVKRLLVTRDELDLEHRAAFTNNYSGPGSPNELDDVLIKWTKISSIIASGTEPLSVAFKFIHRFGTYWYLTAQRLILEETGKDSNFSGDNYWFDIDHTGDANNEGTNPPPGVIDIGGEWHDPNYFLNVASIAGYPDGNRVKSVLMPQNELRYLIAHNTSGARRERDFSIVFAPTSYQVDLAQPVPDALVEWPHCIIAYASHLGTPMIGNGAVVIAAPFRDRGANYDTLCPPSCTRYHWPADLPI